MQPSLLYQGNRPTPGPFFPFGTPALEGPEIQPPASRPPCLTPARQALQPDLKAVSPALRLSCQEPGFSLPLSPSHSLPGSHSSWGSQCVPLPLQEASLTPWSCCFMSPCPWRGFSRGLLFLNTRGLRLLRALREVRLVFGYPAQCLADRGLNETPASRPLAGYFP